MMAAARAAFLILAVGLIHATYAVWTDQWVVTINGTKEHAAAIALKHGCVLLGEIRPGIYHMRHNASKLDKVSPSPHVSRRLAGEASKGLFGLPGSALESQSACLHYPYGSIVDKSMVHGKDVVVTVVDDGIAHTHPDLQANYEPAASYDMNGEDTDPFPNEADPINSHGTRCCGQIAMSLNNGVCGAGIAYNSRIGGIRMLDGDVTDSIEARSLSHNRALVDIYTNSWGPNDDGQTMEGPGPLAEQALADGIAKGRNGLGSIFLFANGNGGWNDNCNADGYANNLYTIAIGAIGAMGESPWYTEQCAATMAVTYSSGNGAEPAIASVDIHNGCTRNHGGTSAASPMAAGILALVLEANPNLNWREVQHLIVRTSRKCAPSDGDWVNNAAGWHVNHKFGFGSLDAAALVAEAEKWKPIGQWLQYAAPHQAVEKAIPFAVSAAGALSPTFTVSPQSTTIRKLEHVQVYVRLSATRRGNNYIELVSPSKTLSVLLTVRSYDYSGDGIDWTFTTVRCWDESPLGDWTLRVRNGVDASTGTLHEWGLILYGTA